ncbi:MAG: tetratricopeptide repeat protein, partial [Bacteroidales bacterium]
MKILTALLLTFLFTLSNCCLNGQDEVRVKELEEIIGKNGKDITTLDALIEIMEKQLQGNVSLVKNYGYKAVILARELNQKEQEVRAYYIMAEAFFIAHQFDSLKILVDKGREILSDEKTNPALWGVLNHVESAMYTKEGKFTLADELLRQSQRIFTMVGDECELGSTLYRIGALAFSNNNYDSAIYYFIEANKKYTICGDSAQIAKVYSNTSKCYINLKDYQQALSNCLKAERIYTRFKKKKSEANNFNILGQIYVMINKFDSAYYYFNKSIALFDSIGLLKSQGAHIYINIGNIFFAKEDYDKAFEYFSLANRMATEINDPHQIVSTIKNLAVTYERRGEYDKALKMYDTCLMIEKKYELNHKMILTYFNIYRTWALKGDYKKAYEYQEIYNSWKDSVYNL